MICIYNYQKNLVVYKKVLCKLLKKSTMCDIITPDYKCNPCLVISKAPKNAFCLVKSIFVSSFVSLMVLVLPDRLVQKEVVSMNKYEMLYIISISAEEEAREAIIKKWNDMVVADGGSVESVEKIGVKKFAYPIQDKMEGYYVLMNFTANPTIVRKMEEQMALTEHFVRKMIIKK